MTEERFVMPEEITSTAKKLPVILMLDVSGSMHGTPIATLNNSVREMLETFSDSESVNAEINVCCVTFGGEVNEAVPLQKASEIEWRDLSANGCTPLGQAISLVDSIVSDKEKIPSNGYRPTVVLVSDGAPTDDWQRPFRAFLESKRGSKCQRLALGINMSEGTPEYNVLKEFVSDGEQVFLGNAGEIAKFFKYATMSVVTRTKSINPNVIPKIVSPYD